MKAQKSSAKPYLVPDLSGGVSPKGCYEKQITLSVSWAAKNTQLRKTMTSVRKGASKKERDPSPAGRDGLSKWSAEGMGVLSDGV